MRGRYKNKKLLGLCKGEPCWLNIPFYCTSYSESVVPAHSPDLHRMHGKSTGVKPHDIFTVPACGACHDVLDGRVKSPYSADDLQEIFDRANAKWIVYLIKSGKLKGVL